LILSRVPNISKLHSQMGMLPILDDRPEPDLVPPPVFLLHDGFDYFMDAVRSEAFDASEKRRNLELVVKDFADQMIGFYPNDVSRSFWGLHSINTILALGDGKRFRAVDINTTYLDSDHVKPYDAASCLVWFKNEFVDLGSPGYPNAHKIIKIAESTRDITIHE
jgi:hypothetical protein